MIMRCLYWFVYSLPLIVTWEYFGQNLNSVRRLISSPSLVFQYTLEHYKSLIDDVIHTLTVAFSALIVAFIIAFILSCLAIIFKGMNNYLLRLSSIFQTIPAIVFIPFFVLLVGVGFFSKLLIAVVVIVFGLIIGCSNALKLSENDLKELMILYEVPKMSILTRFYIPYSIPIFISHVRIAANYSLLGAVIAEFTGSHAGLGKNIFLATIRLEPDLMVVSVGLCFLVATGIHTTMLFVENQLSWVDRDKH